MTLEPMEVVAALYDRLAASEGGMRNVYSPDVRWYQAESHPLAAPGGEAWLGLAALREHVMKPITQTFEGWTMDVDELIPAGGNRVVATGRYVGTHRSSGRRLSAQFCIIYTVADDVIIEGHQYVDTAKIREVMGL